MIDDACDQFSLGNAYCLAFPKATLAARNVCRDPCRDIRIRAIYEIHSGDPASNLSRDDRISNLGLGVWFAVTRSANDSA